MNATLDPKDRTQRAPFHTAEDHGIQRDEDKLRDQIRKSDEFLRRHELNRDHESFIPPNLPC